MDGNDVLGDCSGPPPLLPVPDTQAAPSEICSVGSSGTDLLDAARHLQHTLGRRTSAFTEQYAAAHGVSREVWRTNLWAAAELSAAGQTQFLAGVLDYVEKVQDSYVPIAFIQHVLHDETEVAARVRYAVESLADRELAKAYVIESSWCCLLRRRKGVNEEVSPKDFICVRGNMSPAVRAGSGTSARAVLQVLNSIWSPPLKALSLFNHVIKMSETDALSANRLAERCWNQERPAVKLFHVTCVPHECTKEQNESGLASLRW